MQGRLTNTETAVTVETACHHCSKPLVLEIDSEMNVEVDPPEARPLVFVPDVVPFDVDGPDIVDEF